MKLRAALEAKEVIVSVLVGTLLLTLEEQIVKPWPALGDALSYVALAKNPSAFLASDRSQWRFRLLTPIIVHFLPFSIDVGFKLMTFAALLLSSLLLYRFLRNLGFSMIEGIVGQVLFLSDIGVLYYLANFRLVDPLDLLFLMLGLSFAYSNKKVAFATTLAVGMLNHETTIILAPVYYLIHRKRGSVDSKRLLDSILLSIPAIVTLLILHLALPGGGQSFVLFRSDVYVYNLGLWLTQPVRQIELAVFTWSLLWIFALIGYFHYCRAEKPRRLMYILLFALALLLPSDVSRMLTLAFPAIITYSLYTIAALRRARPYLVMFSLIVQIALQYALAIIVLPK